jgi:GT2 family glycosyltransferase
MKFVFVILHYIALDDTIECIDSIINTIELQNYSIVVVDNGSPDDSGLKLKDIYQGEKNIFILLSGKNLGFAKGNNVGFAFAKNKLHADFIVMINNDTIINQASFLQGVESIYASSPFFVLGPDILSIRGGVHQNPVREKLDSFPRVIIECFRLIVLLTANYVYLDRYAKGALRLAKRNFFKRKSNKFHEHSWEHQADNVKLHGSCLIFSPDFLREFSGLYPDTFMFMEEEILYYICKKLSYKMVYNPSLQILHKEDASTDALYKKAHKKRRFVYKQGLRSSFVFLKLMMTYKKSLGKMLAR